MSNVASFETSYQDLRAMGAAAGPIDGQVLGMDDQPVDMLFTLTEEPPSITRVQLLSTGEKSLANIQRFIRNGDQVDLETGTHIAAVSPTDAAAERYEQATTGMQLGLVAEGVVALALEGLAEDVSVFAQYE